MDSKSYSDECERKKASFQHEALLKSKGATISNMKEAYTRAWEDLRTETLKREKEAMQAKFFEQNLTGHENKRRLKESLAKIAAAHVAARSPRKVKKIAQETGSGSRATNYQDTSSGYISATAASQF